MEFFDVDSIFFVVFGYRMSYLEFVGTVAGAIAIWLSARANIWSWPVGIINVVLFFFLFFQVQLYPDMFLQVFFFVTNLIGWWRWAHPSEAEEDRKKELKISYMVPRQIGMAALITAIGTVIAGMAASRIHIWLPVFFEKPSAFPYIDSFVLVMSVVTTFLMIQKKVECWIAWIIIDAVASGMYFVKDIRFVSLEYLVFCFIAAYGLRTWIREYRTYSATT